MREIAPCIWFDNNALDAARFYVSVFENSKIEHMSEYLEDDLWPDSLPTGTPLNVRLTLCGQGFNVLNGGPVFRPNPSISFYVDCENETQFDALYKVLSDGGMVLMEPGEYPFSKKFSWVQDRYGVSWQLSFSSLKQKVTPYLMFTEKAHGRAEEAINFYSGVFDDAKILNIQRYGKDAGQPEGTVMWASFALCGREFMAADSSYPHGFTFTEGTSLMVYCRDQAEIDKLWEVLTTGGEEQPCGWLKDKFGVSWQIVPDDLERLMDTSDPVRARRMNAALLKMKKIDVEVLHDTYGEE